MYTLTFKKGIEINLKDIELSLTFHTIFTVTLNKHIQGLLQVRVALLVPLRVKNETPLIILNLNYFLTHHIYKIPTDQG
jgi:hypothetical protein